jgi:hypothetical protein
MEPQEGRKEVMVRIGLWRHRKEGKKEVMVRDKVPFRISTELTFD